MAARIRILPATMATAALLLAVKTVEVVHGTENLFIARVEAESTPAADAKPAATPAPMTDKKPEAAKPADGKKEEKKEDKKEGDGKEKEAGKEGDKKPEKPNPAVSEEPPVSLERHYSAIELQLLENLAKRREELDRWERNISIKEQVLVEAEKRIDEKTMQIDGMKKEVTDLLALYNSQEDAKIKSLVKIYEAMKPKDAAKIFNELEMPVLLLVVDKMAEKKVAPVLAEMSPLKAKQITVDLAEERRINSAKLTSPPMGK